MRARAAAALLALCAAFLAGCSAYADNGSEWLEVSDLPYVWEFDASQDMQLPELPTGCEATALSTLMRMHGVAVTKTEVADVMPKSDGDDFVNAFWGDPYSEHGWACMAPCVVDTANALLPSGMTAVDLTGAELGQLPAPCVVWVTMGLDGPMLTGYEQDGYKLLGNPHCMTLMSVGEEAVQVVDPLCGAREYPLSRFNEAYIANGCQAVCIADEGSAPLN